VRVLISQVMQWTSLALLLGLTGRGLLLLKIGGWYFDHRSGTAQSAGAAATLIGLTLLIASLAIIWVVRIRHLLHYTLTGGQNV
jgi:hypothetical protein